MTDRRNYRYRALTVQRLLEHLRANPSGVHTDELGDPQLARAAAVRILKRLASRGLVRLAEGRWQPRPVLFNGATLERTKVAA